MPPTKRQKAAVAASIPVSHSKTCHLHQDPHSRKRVCNARKNNGQRCSHKVTASRADASWESGHLPVCRVHEDQKIRRGACQAMAPCGEKCNRPCVGAGPENQLCGIHVGTMLTDHFSKLATEIKSMIFECVIPPGSVRATPVDSDVYTLRYLRPNERLRRRAAANTTYATAAALLRVNKEISLQVSDLLYGSLSRPVKVVIDPLGIDIFRTGWTASLTQAIRVVDIDRHISCIDVSNIKRVRHFEVLIKGFLTPQTDEDTVVDRNDEEDELISAVANITRFVHFIMQHSGTMLETASSLVLEKLTVKILFENRGRPDEKFAAAKLLLHAFRMLPIQPEVCLEWEFVTDPKAGRWPIKKSKMALKGNNLTFKSVNDSLKQEAKFGVNDFVDSNNLPQFSPSTMKSMEETFYLFRAVEDMMLDMRVLNLEGERSPQSQFQALWKRIKLAWVSRDDDTLNKIKEDLVAAWKDYALSFRSSADGFEARHINNTAQATVVRPKQTDKDINCIKILEWPSVPSVEPFPTENVTRTLSGAMEVASLIVGSLFVGVRYRLVTPHLVRKRRAEADAAKLATLDSGEDDGDDGAETGESEEEEEDV